ncbi:uncharacterized protein B0H18DRAFT_1127247 [Fomitopsis serialis]|uniref:uncharacterized protein n=1 Tax=Fomitopsis serialis TaxID=139415 RepID=UPI002008C22B|nr:uncharacterized protein B0H18DRAFT_1127247 [Neoantrodia serialis]KAH9912381.1 hypothetical protein B0H18DRAFT_1127247 [Neoantrodia serialis]
MDNRPLSQSSLDPGLLAGFTPAQLAQLRRALDSTPTASSPGPQGPTMSSSAPNTGQPDASPAAASAAPPITPYHSHRSHLSLSSLAPPEPPQLAFSAAPAPLFPTYGSQPAPSLGFPGVMQAAMPLAAPSPTQPFVGFNATQAPGTSQRVNIERRTSAARNAAGPSRQPRGASSAPRATRSRRSQAPVVPRGIHKEIGPCLTEAGQLRLVAHVYPPSLAPDAESMGYKFPLFQFRYSTMRDYLNSFGLARTYERPFETSIVTFVEDIIADLRASPLGYDFAQVLNFSQHRHEQLELQLLSLHNKGTPTQDGQAWLHRYPVAPDMTIATLASSMFVLYFCKPRLCIRDGALHVYFVVANAPVSLRLPSALPDSPPLPHTCISDGFYNGLPRDGTPGSGHARDSNVLCDSTCLARDSELTSSSDTDDEVEEALGLVGPTSPGLESLSLDDGPAGPTAPAAVSNAPSHPRQRVSARLRRAGQAQLSSIPALQRTQTIPCFVLDLIPPRLGWSTPYRPASGSYHPAVRCEALAELRNAVFEAASDGQRPSCRLRIDGSDVPHMAVIFKDMLGQAAVNGDFTHILAMNRSFRAIQHHEVGDLPLVASFGDGLERQTMMVLLAEFSRCLPSYFMTRLGENSNVLACPPRALSPAQKEELGALGAIVGLCLVNGMAIPKIAGEWLIYLLNGCNFEAITREVTQAFHPRLAAEIIQLDSIGTTGDLTPFEEDFVIYLGKHTALYTIRDEETHAAFAPMLLYKALLGDDTVAEHTDTRAFRAGFELPCHNGFTLSKAAQAFAGGPAALVMAACSTRIGSYESLKPYLDIIVKHTVPLPLKTIAFDDGRASLGDVVRGFLQRTGIPCAASFERKRAAGTFTSDLVSLEEIDSPSFRPRMLAIAATGSDSIVGSEKIKITFVGNSDEAYACPVASRAFCEKEGIVSWQTCFKEGVVPTAYLAQLVHEVYDPNSVDKPTSLLNAIDSWLLEELLSAITSPHGGIL